MMLQARIIVPLQGLLSEHLPGLKQLCLHMPFQVLESMKHDEIEAVFDGYVDNALNIEVVGDLVDATLYLVHVLLVVSYCALLPYAQLQLTWFLVGPLLLVRLQHVTDARLLTHSIIVVVDVPDVVHHFDLHFDVALIELVFYWHASLGLNILPLVVRFVKFDDLSDIGDQLVRYGHFLDLPL